ncbi:MAG: rhodanese-like domain-containing protein, partial [Elainellaceae cyanobacterium]
MVWIVLGVVVALAIALFQLFWGGDGFRESPAVSQQESSTLSSVPNRTDWSQTWAISASEANALLDRPNTILLDARGLIRRVLTHIEGAIPVHWRSFSQTDTSRQGNLLEYDDPNQRQVLEQKIRDLGISEQTVVLVYGEPIHGWGEEGRIVWMLKTLGHDSVALIDGGISALIENGAATSLLPSYTIPDTGQFQIRARSDWTVTHEDLRRLLNVSEESSPQAASSEEFFETSSQISLVDTREAREYEGETPYGELRGGHLPGA